MIFRKIYSKIYFSNFLMILVSKLYLFYKIRIKKNLDYKNLIIKKDKNGGYLIDDNIDKFKIYHLNKLPRYFRGFQFSQKGTIDTYGFNRHFFLPKGANVLNVGANIGEVALGFLNNNINVIAIEADKIQFDILNKNKDYFLNKNNNANVFFKTFNVAVSNLTTSKEFYLRPVDNDSTLIKPLESEEKKYTKTIVKTYRIDDLFSKFKIDLIIGDVEGHEPEILIGACNTLKNCKYVALDCSQEKNGQDTIDETIDILKTNNFKIIKKPEKFERPVVIGQNNLIT